MHRKALLGLLAVVASVTVLAPAASAAIPPQGKIGPNQYFAGSVNGQSGVVSPAAIKMACFGPIKPGQMGHPMKGQTVEVFRPVAILTTDGFTGNATSITAFFGPPPPSAVASMTDTVTFHQYEVMKKIPTSLLLPCAGMGNVYFIAGPGPISRPAVVQVTFVGQP